ncbi:Hpt domain-containing protein [Limibacter armeniacum]|uniref:Hpt domain-containing protein n=1 Tax=Limibacter armeniacum TaxID=466084 RepID=UPI002FE65C16
MQQLSDFSYILKFGNNNYTLLKEMIELFIEKAPEDLSLAKKYIEAKDWQNAHHHLHSLKSSINFVACEQIRSKVLAIEQNTKHLENVESIPNNFIELEILCAQLIEELNSKLATL